MCIGERGDARRPARPGYREQVNRFGFATADVARTLLAQADRFLTAAPYHYRVNIQQDSRFEPVFWEYTLSDETPPRHPGINYPPWTAMTQEQRDDAITVRLKSLAFAYLLTGDARYAEGAKSIALNLAHWEWWSDLTTAAALRAWTPGISPRMGLFYDWCYDTLSRGTRPSRGVIERAWRRLPGIAPSTGANGGRC